MTTKSPIVVPVPFEDKNGDKIIDFGTANRKKYAAQLGGAKRIHYQGQTAEGHVYWPEGYKPPVATPAPAPVPGPVPEPTPVPAPTPAPAPVPDPVPAPVPTPAHDPEPVSTVLVIEKAGEVFLQNEHLAIGVNESGTLGTKGKAPAGFTTAKAMGYERLGLLRVEEGKVLSGEMLKGMPVAGWVVTYDGVSVRNMGVIETDMPGKLEAVTNGANFHGEKGSLSVDQTITLEPGEPSAQFLVEIVNVGSRLLKNLRYMFVTDPDVDPADGAFVTQNRFVDRRTVQAIAGGQTMTLTTTDERAFANIMPLPGGMPSFDTHATLKAPSFTSKGDDAIHLVFALPDLAPGEATRFVFRLGIEASQ